jgi:hypothetical protein
MGLAADAQLYSFHVYFVGSKVSSQKRGGSKGINQIISTFLDHKWFQHLGQKFGVSLEVTKATKISS